MTHISSFLTRRGSKHGDDANQPVLEETGQGGVERSVAGEETRPGQNTLAAELLDQTTLGENDTENIAKGGQGDEDRESTFGSAAHDVTEKGCRHKATTLKYLLSRDSGEVGNIDQHVKDGDGDDTDRGGNLEGTDGVLGLAEGIVGVTVSNVTPDDVVESSDDTVGAAGGSLECVLEVLGLLVLG